jgi:hypothetical protein
MKGTAHTGEGAGMRAVDQREGCGGGWRVTPNEDRNGGTR